MLSLDAFDLFEEDFLLQQELSAEAQAALEAANAAKIEEFVESLPF